MNKVERDRCEKLISEANRNIYEARESSGKNTKSVKKKAMK